MDAQPDDDPVDAEAEVLLASGGGDGVEEEAAERHLGPALVAQGVIDDDPDGTGRDESGDDQEDEDFAEFQSHLAEAEKE